MPGRRSISVSQTGISAGVRGKASGRCSIRDRLWSLSLRFGRKRFGGIFTGNSRSGKGRPGDAHNLTRGRYSAALVIGLLVAIAQTLGIQDTAARYRNGIRGRTQRNAAAGTGADTGIWCPAAAQVQHSGLQFNWAHMIIVGFIACGINSSAYMAEIITKRTAGHRHRGRRKRRGPSVLSQRTDHEIS